MIYEAKERAVEFNFWNCDSKTLNLKPIHTPMQLLQLQSLTLPLLPKPLNLIPKLPLKTQRNPLPVLSCSPTDQELHVLEAAVLDSDEKSLPCVRTYENDSSRLALVGAVSFHQALTAAAADGGRAADEHLDSGIPAMVVETVFPARSDDHSTVSTRLVPSFPSPSLSFNNGL